MYGITYVIYFKIYHYLEYYKKPKPKTKEVKKISIKKKEHIKKYMREKYLNNKKFDITLSPIYE
jgi:hypothetical protein